MPQEISNTRASITGFIAGFLAVPLFHQLAMGLFYILGIIPFAPFDMAATQPLGIPVVLSASFWGGVWGVVFAFTILRLRGASYWAWNIIAGAVLLSVVAAFIVSPLKQMGIMWGWSFAIMAFALYVNAAWGLGLALFYRLFNR